MDAELRYAPSGRQTGLAASPDVTMTRSCKPGLVPMENKPSNPHDHFFKASWSRPDVARGFFAHFLPPEVIARLDLQTLELTKDSFIDEHLQDTYSDLLYKVQTRDGHPVYIYVLLEHKSYFDRWTGFQVLGYQMRIWEQERKAGAERLAPILTVVLYHGARPWRLEPTFGVLVDTDEVLRPFTPELRYLLCDLSRYSEDEIKGQATLQVALLLLKHVLRGELVEKLPAIVELLRKLGSQTDGLGYLRTVLQYLAQTVRPGHEPVVHQTFIGALPNTGDETMKTIADHWAEQGIDLETGIDRMIMELMIGKRIQEEIEKSQMHEAQRNVIAVLEGRFQTLPEALAQRVQALEDLSVLHELVVKAATADSLDTFRQALDDRLQGH